MHATVWAEIDRSAFRHNIHCVRELSPDSRIVAMIKANAYGHGLIDAAKTLGPLCDKLGVARIDEAVQLRSEGIQAPLLLMGTWLSGSEIAWCAENNVAVAIHTTDMAQLAAGENLTRKLEVWLKVDTGMNRLGLAPDSLQSAYSVLAKAPQIGPIRLMSHFSSADDPQHPATERQMDQFERLARQLPAMEYSLANSAGLIAWPQSRQQWVRPGIMLYGDDPTGGHALGLRPVMRLKSRIIAIKDVLEGNSVGYNARWTAARPSRIAAIGIGYGDGYPRQLPNGTPVLVNGQIFPLVGRVSMDICSIDITAAQQPISIGDDVTLWGDGLPATDIAAMAGTISYHLYTGVTQRVQRVFIETA